MSFIPCILLVFQSVAKSGTIMNIIDQWSTEPAQSHVISSITLAGIL